MTVEPITVWAAFGAFVLGVLVGALVVLGEWKRARRRWLEATRAWHEVKSGRGGAPGRAQQITATPRTRYAGGNS